MINSIESD